MLSYFHSWRRKLGVLTLATACALTAGWLRSYAQIDLIFLPQVCVVSSANGEFALSRSVRLKSELTTGSGHGTIEVEFESTSFLSQFKWTTTDLGSTKILHPRMIPFWWVVGPLTGVSAWLLLSKPRPKQNSSV